MDELNENFRINKSKNSFNLILYLILHMKKVSLFINFVESKIFNFKFHSY